MLTHVNCHHCWISWCSCCYSYWWSYLFLSGFAAATRAVTTSGTTPMPSISAAARAGGTTPMPSIAAAAQAVPTGYIYNNVQLGYCWTHGLTKHPEHTSATCNHPSSGHQLNATLDRRMGGSIRIFGNGTCTNRTPRIPPLPTPPA